MDISILLALQEFRNGAGGCLTHFMLKMSFLGEMNTVLIIIALIYWCVSKSYGQYFLMGWSGTRVVQGFLKVTACTYRPWIRDPRIMPDSEALITATGYSFPSGHSMNAASLFGGGAIRKEFPKALRIVLAVILVLIIFSRNFLSRKISRRRIKEFIRKIRLHRLKHSSRYWRRCRMIQINHTYNYNIKVLFRQKII